MPVTIEQVRQALNLTDFDVEAAHVKMAPLTRAIHKPSGKSGSARLGGVLLLLFRMQKEMHLLLTRRRDDLPSHAGQISFPGGRNEAPESLLDTALRETEEEVGVGSSGLQILGAMRPIYIPPSDYEVHPFVAWYSGGKPLQFKAAPREVAEIITAPLATLLDPAFQREEPWQLQDQQMMIPYFAIQDHKVWGATAIMLSEFVERMRTILT